MGIRFQCPNGHPLNVKSYLAGRRGICPKCSARFLVPVTSGGPAIPDLEQSKIEQTTQEEPEEPVEPVVSTIPPARTTTSEAPDSTSLWYVRNDTDQQFGPVETNVIRQWLTEGRVSSHSWVWRTGWPQWKQADQAFATTVHQPPVQTADESAMEPAPALTPPSTPVLSTPVPVTPPIPQSLPLTEPTRPDPPSVAHRKRIGQRKKRRVQVTLLLTLVVVLLFVGLLIVVLS
jgi:hypothetical protein